MAKIEKYADWGIIQSFFGDNYLEKLIEHQLDSYNDFITNKIPQIITTMSPITVWNEYSEDHKKYKYEVQMHISEPTWEKPKIKETSGHTKLMTPYDARHRNYTYNASMFVNITFIIKEYFGKAYEEHKVIHNETFKNIHYGRIPVMINSKLCVLKDIKLPPSEVHECSQDTGGYFIIKGGERVILGAEKVADNRVMVYYNKKFPKHPYTAEIKSLSEENSMTPKKLELKLLNQFNGEGYPIVATIPRFTAEIPVCILFKAIGIETDEDIFRCIWRDLESPNNQDMISAFKGCCLQSSSAEVFNKESAIEYLKSRCGGNPEDALNTEFLPHCKTGNQAKAYILGSMINKLLAVWAGKRLLDDRDSYINKRMVLPGTLLTQRFRQLYQKVVKDMKSKLNQECNQALWKKDGHTGLLVNKSNILKIIRMSVLEIKFQRSIATGNFIPEGSNSTGKTGVSQVLNRLSYCATISHLRRLQTPVEKSGRMVPPRKLHGTSWGYICPAETPEGGHVGLVKTLTMGSSITMSFPMTVIRSSLEGNKLLTNIEKHHPKSYTNRDVIVYINYAPFWVTNDPVSIYKLCKEFKRNGTWHPHTSVAWNVQSNSIEIETDMGRIVRPVFRTIDGKIPDYNPTDKWDKLLETSIEYISPLETESSLIASDLERLVTTEEGKIMKYSHAEIHPSMILGFMTSLIPFSDLNQSPRNCYSANMSKQGVGYYVTNPQDRMDKNGYVLCTPQRPLVHTRMYDSLNLHKTPYGFNAILAIQSYTGYNQEDSVIMNSGFIKRGGFHSLYYSIYTDEENLNISSGKDEHFLKPDPTTTTGYMKDVSYEHLTEDGTPKINAVIQPDDIIIGKVIATRDGSMFKDASSSYKGSEPARVDAVYKMRNSDGFPSIKVRTCSYRLPDIGNKFSTLHAQKGTLGMVLNEEDMPMTSSGIRPDIIMNPHAIPSRMTIGQVMEMLLGKACVNKGMYGDGTAFSHMDSESIQKELRAQGWIDTGDEIMYNGMTGEQMPCRIFMCPINYMALKHMTLDKIHSRASGRVVLLTRQPCEGRSREGGLRVGEMERDSLLSHGAARFVRERLMEVSDAYQSWICKKCGEIPIFNKVEHSAHCPKCDNYTDFSITKLPYAMKLLCQEMACMGIQTHYVMDA